MPSRVIREGLLDSERYWAVTIEARQLFWHLMLLADDIGCVSLAPIFIRRRCFDSAPSPEKITALVTHLADADLIRVYETDGARYAFIPRFRQTLRRMTLKHPEPPSALLQGDLDAQEKFRIIKEEPIDLHGNGSADAPHLRAEGNGNEGNGNEVTTVAKTLLSPCPHLEIITAYHQQLPMGQRVNLKLWNGTRAKHLLARWREDSERQSVDFWRGLFEYVAKSKFLTGRSTPTMGRPPFEVNLGWIVKPENFAKIVEGSYHRE